MSTIQNPADMDTNIAGCSCLDTISDKRSVELIKTFYPESEIKKDLGDYETLISVEKAIKILGWNPQATWRKK